MRWIMPLLLPWGCVCFSTLPGLTLKPFPRSSVALADFDPRVSPHAYGNRRLGAVGVIIVDHGSKREAANRQLHEVAEAVKRTTGHVIVEAAHMEIAQPSLKDAYAKCVEQGALRVVCHPFFLSPGRHVTEDIPSLLAEAAANFPDVPYVLTLPLGASQAIPSLIAESVAETLQHYPTSTGLHEDGGLLMEIMRMTQQEIADSDQDKAAEGSISTRPPSIEELANSPSQ